MECLTFVKYFVMSVILLSVKLSHAQEEQMPNILWIMAEDISPDLSCYGVKGVRTPHLDELAKQGIRYTNAFVTGPVCSTSRSAMMVGVHQQTIGAHQHRTRDKQLLPEPYLPFVHMLEDAGYYTCSLDNKTDLNFKLERPLMMGKDWKNREKGQLFFAKITLHNTHRPWVGDKKRPVDPSKVVLPPYYPDTKLLRKDWALGLGEIQVMDRRVGQLLKRLKDEGLSENTLVIFTSDHGRCHVRGKQFLYDGGIGIPMIIRWPKKIKAGQVSDDLVMSIDITKTILNVSGAQSLDYLQGLDLFDGSTAGRTSIFASRDKMDQTHDAMRAVRTKTFKYILNLMPERPWMQYNRYKLSQYPATAVLNAMFLSGTLNKDQAKFMAKTKPVEELYDIKKDPYELHNLAKDPKYAKALKKMQGRMKFYQGMVNDQGVSQTFKDSGWPATYPYKTLEQWEVMVKQWEEKILAGKKVKIKIGRVLRVK